MTMALTWIIWRTEAALREVCFRCHTWRDCGQAVGVDVSVSVLRRIAEELRCITEKRGQNASLTR
jgi:hypothetical protein